MSAGETSIKALKHRCADAPQDLDNTLNLIERYCSLGKFKDALELCRAAMQYHSRAYSFLLVFANVLFRHGDLKEARLVFERLASLRPDRIEAWNNLGVLEFSAGDFDAACKAFDNVLRIDSKNAGALCNLGNCHAGKGDASVAAAYFERAVDARGDFVDAWYNLGNACITLRRFGEAKAAFESAVRYDEGFGSAYKNWGVACKELGEYDEALEHFEKAASLNRDDAGVHANMSGVYTRMGHHGKALECAKRAVRLAPGEPLSWDALREAAMALGDGQQYYRAVSAFIGSINDDGLARSISDLRGMGFEQEAEELLKYAVRLNRKGASVDALPFAESVAPEFGASEMDRQLYKLFGKKEYAECAD
ncbi:MAG: tetratricopeptide repeat protein [Chitinispirillales bacterium]|jgi:tetratricopeptide (TPR) repeat protein|nr:tetratricopeptide repeat protein [Chitinispirillales bacterium]